VELGAELLEGWSFESLSDVPQSPVSVVLKRNSELRVVRARAVIAADGANSRVRTFLKVPRNGPRLTGIAIRAYGDSEREAKANTLIFEWSDRLLPAYAWYFPTSSQVVNVGLGLVVRDSQKRRFRLRENLDEFVKLLDKRHLTITDLRDARTYLLPHGAQLPRLAHGRVILVGDAGSMINPLSGEGIFYGMFAGAEVARMFTQLNSTSSIEDVFTAAETMFRKRFIWHYRSNYIASVMLRSRRWARLVIRAAGRDPKVLASGVELLFGEGRLSIATSFRIVWAARPW
jgi:flavin-dependent dehydrogenase